MLQLSTLGYIAHKLVSKISASQQSRRTDNKQSSNVTQTGVEKTAQTFPHRQCNMPLHRQRKSCKFSSSTRINSTKVVQNYTTSAHCAPTQLTFTKRQHPPAHIAYFSVKQTFWKQTAIIAQAKKKFEIFFSVRLISFNSIYFNTFYHSERFRFID